MVGREVVQNMPAPLAVFDPEQATGAVHLVAGQLLGVSHKNSIWGVIVFEQQLPHLLYSGIVSVVYKIIGHVEQEGPGILAPGQNPTQQHYNKLWLMGPIPK